MNIYKVLPDLNRHRQLALWHRALRSQWSAEDVDWSRPQRLTSPRLRDHLARVLTPVLMGEQAALYSVSALIPILGHQSEVESQFYLTTWAVDEARHTELFTRFYGRLGREPLPIRRFQSGYLFQSQIASREPTEWLAGVLVSEVLAKLVLEELLQLDLDPVLSEICHGILRDEARHLGFNQIYMEDRFAELARREGSDSLQTEVRVRRRLRAVLDRVPPMLDAVADELAELGIDRQQLRERLERDANRRLHRSVERGRALASSEPLTAAS